MGIEINKGIFQAMLGRRLSMSRRNAGKTRKEAGAATGCSAATVGRWERGEASPTLSEIYALASLYRHPFSELALGTQSESRSELPPELIDISELWPDTQNIVRRHIEYLRTSQRLMEENWPVTVKQIKSGGRDVDPPWKF